MSLSFSPGNPALESVKPAANRTAKLLSAAKNHILFTANRPDIIMEKGEGMMLYDTDGNAYLDFIGGWAVNCLGHSPAVLQQALAEQAGELVHASPGFYNKPQAEFAELLTQVSGMDKVFFTSTGAEANESAVKLARKHGALHLNGAYEIITLTNSFHGRTLAMMSATGKSQWEPLFAPKVNGFVHVPINDLDACFAAVTNNTCAIMVELVQGEGGVHALSEAYLYGLRKICDMYGILLIFDEVQTGLGRTGKLFAYQHYGIAPDILTLGKGIGAGFPLSAMLTKEPFDLFEPGDQGGTYTGQPLGMAAGLAVLRELLKRDLAANAEKQGRYLKAELEGLASRYPISNVRGIGLLLAFDVPSGAAPKLAETCMRLGLLINAANAVTIRIMPALIVEPHHIDEMIAILEDALHQCFMHVG
ncbi:acetylornithine/succinylornithine family transaminase [Paenibacillus nanensis]|uniref:Acetylornithine/succinylornithine family transaminase n=1 Tax=Paenibacillus nanensis TaxID=393251 RepID=A0A3A1V2B6_9BACL|nr:acetylornithine/succinylornithine family transaminase [Paenibacillus nanensis]RIX52693.1 acetylornithine/succinylornithine family transaminase [Paenibacillus nanensis]